MLRKITLSLILLFFVACASMGPQDVKKVDSTQFYNGAGIVGYFLPEVPEWTMLSESGQCSRNKRIRFIDIPILRRSFSLNYEMAHQMQLMFNLELGKKLSDVGAPFLALKEEESLFYQVLDQISAHFKIFSPPTYKQVNIVWIDLAINNPEVLARLKKLVSGSLLDEGHPVLVSSCLTYKEIEMFASELGLQGRDIRFISYEMLSIFDDENKRNYQLGINLDHLFKKDQKLFFWTPSTDKNVAFRGKLTYQKY